MRITTVLRTIPALAAFIGLASAIGCTGLANDCELKLTCPVETTTTTSSTTTTTTSSTSSTTTSSTTSTTDVSMCAGIFKGACDACIQKNCCKQIANCAADPSCLDYCLLSVWPPLPQCMTPETATLLDIVNACFSEDCSPDCNAYDYCNPVTNTPCPTDGTACDLAYPGVFLCLPPVGMAVPLCQTCNNEIGPYCNGGMRCHQPSKTCARYCCDDGDCGSGKCVLDQMAAFGGPLLLPNDKVGICLDQAGTTAACDAPAMAPSNGACVGGFPP